MQGLNGDSGEGSQQHLTHSEHHSGAGLGWGGSLIPPQSAGHRSQRLPEPGLPLTLCQPPSGPSSSATSDPAVTSTLECVFLLPGPQLTHLWKEGPVGVRTSLWAMCGAKASLGGRRGGRFDLDVRVLAKCAHLCSGRTGWKAREAPRPSELSASCQMQAGEGVFYIADTHMHTQHAREHALCTHTQAHAGTCHGVPFALCSTPPVRSCGELGCFHR